MQKCNTSFDPYRNLLESTHLDEILAVKILLNFWS